MPNDDEKKPPIPVDRSGVIEVPGAPYTPEEIAAAKYPARQELTVLPGDEVKELTLGWTIREYLGCEVFPYNPEDHPDGVNRGKLEPITSEDGLKAGDTILVPTLIGGYHVMTVTKDEYGVLYAGDEGTMASLKFGDDDRNVWTCVGLINKRGLKKLELRTD